MPGCGAEAFIAVFMRTSLRPASGHRCTAVPLPQHWREVGETLASLAGQVARSGRSVRLPIQVARSSRGEEALVELAGGWAGGDPELVPQARAQLAVDAQGFG